MKNTMSRENERDDKFLGAAGSMGHRGWIQKEDRDSRDSPPRSTKLRPVNYVELFTDLSPALLLLYFRKMKSDGKYREGVRGERKKHTEKRKPSFAGMSGQERLLLLRDVIYFILVV